MFVLAKMDVGNTPPVEFRKAAGTVQLGEALKLSAGELTVCGATDVPEYVAAGPNDEDGLAPVIRVGHHQEFETTLAAAPATGTLTAGSKVTLHTDGMQITATTEGGVAEITRLDGQTAGSLARVRF